MTRNGYSGERAACGCIISNDKEAQRQWGLSPIVPRCSHLQKCAAQGSSAGKRHFPMSVHYVELGATRSQHEMNVFVLVHGTFARGSAWVAKDSPICRTIRTASEDTPCRIIAFKWTGKNSHSERIRAGKMLERLIVKLVRIRPHARIFLIGHSHGGNVILYANRSGAVQNRIAGVVCMATPFIDCEQRNILLPAILCSFAVLVAGLFGVVFGGIALTQSLPAADLKGYAVPAAWVLYCWAFLFALEPTMEWVEAKQKEIKGEIRASEVSAPVLNLYFPGDEAHLWLYLLSSASEVPYWIWAIGKYIAFISGVISAAMILLMCIIMILELANVPITPRHHPALQPTYDLILELFLTALKVLGFSIAGLVAGQLVLLVIPLLIRAHLFGFGGEFFMYNWLCRIRVSRFPTQCRLLDSRKIPVPSGVRLSGLRHCLIYECDDTHKELSNWLRHLQNL